MHKGSPNFYSRFAWLTPVTTNQNISNSWLLTEDHSSNISELEKRHCRHVTPSSLLQLASDALGIATRVSNQTTELCWTSPCARIKVSWHRSQCNSNRLFVQHPNDYFTRIEVHVDERLLAAYQEPVWPHLPREEPSSNQRLLLPVNCLEALETGAKQNTESFAAGHEDTTPLDVEVRYQFDGAA